MEKEDPKKNPRDNEDGGYVRKNSEEIYQVYVPGSKNYEVVISRRGQR